MKDCVTVNNRGDRTRTYSRDIICEAPIVSEWGGRRSMVQTMHTTSFIPCILCGLRVNLSIIVMVSCSQFCRSLYRPCGICRPTISPSVYSSRKVQIRLLRHQRAKSIGAALTDHSSNRTCRLQTGARSLLHLPQFALRQAFAMCTINDLERHLS